MSEEKSKAEATIRLIPFAITFPLFCIAIGGCWENGCQGALNAQSAALHTAVEYGGWIKGGDSHE